jgi:hypothetical protein
MRRYNQAINPVKKQKGEQLVKFALMLRGGQHYPDDEALALYGAFITDTEAQAAQVRAEHALLAQPRKVFHAIGIDPQHWHRGAPAPPSPSPTPLPASEGKTYDVLVLGDLTSPTRPELLIDKGGRRLFVGRSVDASSREIAQELRAAGVEVSSWLNASQRAHLYRSAALVYFPMSEEGAGEMELLEALACGAEVEVEHDNARLNELLERSLQNGMPDHTSYASTLRDAVWSVLVPNAAT